MNILFTRSLAKRLAGRGVTVNAVHPGAVATNIGAPPKPIAMITKLILKTPVRGAQTTLHVATSPEVEGITGSYFANSRDHSRKLAKRAKDDALAEQLWDVSSALVGLS
jgi:NAD(P)-dependent dehydrogenase (short-subunit alcohol dehydrogenase family)